MLAVGQLVGEWLPAADLAPYLERGDLVEFRRTTMIGGKQHQVYAHWAVYIGKLEDIPRVVHISTDDGDFVTIEQSLRATDSVSGFSKLFKGNTAEVRCDPLFVVARDDVVRVNNSMDADNRPFPPSIVVDRATHKMGAGDYNIILNNCEHFVKWCRYGHKISSQATAAKSGALVSSLALVGVNPFVAVGAGLVFAFAARPVTRYINNTFPVNFSFF